jgi:hypothetical protein
MEDSGEQTARRQATLPVRWLVTAAVLVGIGVLIWLNGHRVLVKPFGQAPLNQIMAVPLLVGIVMGWSARSWLAARAARKAARMAAQKQE